MIPVVHIPIGLNLDIIFHIHAVAISVICVTIASSVSLSVTQTIAVALVSLIIAIPSFTVLFSGYHETSTCQHCLARVISRSYLFVRNGFLPDVT